MNPSCPVYTPGDVFKAPVVTPIDVVSKDSITAVAPELPPVIVSPAVKVPDTG